MVAVYYINQPETKLTSFVEEVEKRYNCTMTKMESEDSVYIAAYTAETTINGRTAYVMVCYDQHKSIEIYYGLC